MPPKPTDTDKGLNAATERVPGIIVRHEVRKGPLAQIPPGVVHGARSRMRVLVVGIPDVADDDYFPVQGA